jgi:hypothetical protein
MAINDEPSIQNMPYKPGEGGAGIKKMPYTPPKNGSGPTFENMPFNKNGGIGNSPYGPNATPAPKATPNPPKGMGDFTKPAPRLNPIKPPMGPYPTNPPDRGNNSNRSVGAGIASNLFNNAKGYVTNLARSVRDVPTALGTALDTRGAMSTGSNGNNNPMAPIKNLATQVGQVGTSILGKRDATPSDKYVGPNKTYQDSLVRPQRARPQRGGRGR